MMRDSGRFIDLDVERLSQRRMRAVRRSVLDTGNERPDPREADLLDRDWFERGLRQEAGEVEIGLEPDVHRKWRDGALEFRQ